MAKVFKKQFGGGIFRENTDIVRTFFSHVIKIGRKLSLKQPKCLFEFIITSLCYLKFLRFNKNLFGPLDLLTRHSRSLNFPICLMNGVKLDYLTKKQWSFASSPPHSCTTTMCLILLLLKVLQSYPRFWLMRLEGEHLHISHGDFAGALWGFTLPSKTPAPLCTALTISMTSLLTQTVAHSTRPYFRPKTNNQTLKKFLSLAVSWVKVVKNGKILTFKVNFLCQKLSESF